MRVFVYLLVALGVGLGCAEHPTYTNEDIALNDRGVAQMGRYEYTDAEKTFAELVARAPGWLDARVNHAIATLNRQAEGDEQLALAILARVLDEDRGHLRALYTSGILYLYLGEASIAVERLQQVTIGDPQDAYAAYFLGQSLLQDGNYADASRWLLLAAQLDPYLRSAYWAAAQALRRLDRGDEASQLIADYQRFAANPAARLAGFSYARMGPRARVLAVNVADSAPVAKPAGPLFASPFALPLSADSQWREANVTTADVDGDGFLDLFVAGSQANAFLRGNAAGRFNVIAGHPLSAVGQINAALWGDVDDDGNVDVVLCRASGIEFWRQGDDGTWANTDMQTDTSTHCAAGAIFDADHDGDLDVFTTGLAGNELYSNNRDGSFRRLAESVGLQGRGLQGSGLQVSGLQVVVADLDGDRDLDIFVLNDKPPHDVWQNDRTWQYEQFPGFAELRAAELVALTVADTDSDGHAEIFTVSKLGGVDRWQAVDNASWQASNLISAENPVTQAELAVVDFDGDGRLELLRTSSSGFAVIDPQTGRILLDESLDELSSAIPLTLDPAAGPALVIVDSAGLKVWPAGSGRHPFIAIAPTGRSEADQMRSNASGIGTRIKARVAGRWTVIDAIDSHSGPGQSLAPYSVGLNGHSEADFVALEWSDGVSQTEIELAAGELYQIAETQRQLASCPVLFVWDGEKYRFISDVLGVAGLGFLSAPGEYTPPRPFEVFLFDADVLAERDGRYHVKLNEPMEENAYLDAATLHVFDIPSGWSLVMDERMGVQGPSPTGRPIFYRHSLDPVRAWTAAGADVTELVLRQDLNAPPPGAVDRRFVGLLAEKQVLTLEFAEPIDRKGAVLVADGWVEYGYSQTVFAAWQAGKRYEAPTLEARDSEGKWHVVAAEFGYPAGMPRKMALPLPLQELPHGADALRLSSNMEIYWDRVQIVFEETLSDIRHISLEPVVARIARTGFAKRTNGPQRVPAYDYNERSPYWDTKLQRGYYTAPGDALELVADVDGAVAIIGGGGEIHLEFVAPPAPAPGEVRYFAIDVRGWAKDMDLYTKDGETVAPIPTLPELDAAALARRDRLHERYNVRFQEGL